MNDKQSTDQWREHLHSAVVALRLGMEGMAGERMTLFIDALASQLATRPPQQVQCLTPFLEQALAAQAGRDFLRLADLLQYEIEPLLNRPI